MILQPERFKLMKLTYLLSPLLALLTLATLSQAQGTSAAVTTTFSNMEGVNGELSSVVYSDRSGNPILKNSGFIAIGTFNLERAEIEALATAADLDSAFHQFGEAANFNSTENGAFQANASGNPAEEYDVGSSFDGAAVYLVIGDGADLSTSSEFLVWKSDQFFDGSGPTGGPSELMLSVDTGDLIIGRSDKNTSDFSSIGGDAGRAAFTTVMIDESLDDHGNTQETATFLAANSTISGNLKDGDDVDFFRIDLSEDGNLSLGVSGGSNIELSIYNEASVELVRIQSPDQEVDSDLAAGTYFVKVSGDLGDYSLESAFGVKIIDLDPESAGTYYGLVRYKTNGKFLGHIQIVITQDGYYSGYLKGMFGYSSSFKGAVTPDYSASIMHNNVFGTLSNMIIKLSKNNWGSYEIDGQFTKPLDSEPNHRFVLRAAEYSKDKPVPWKQRGRYTMRIASSSLTDQTIPAGDGYASGTLWKGGWFSLSGRSNSGVKYTYSSPLLRGNYIPFFTRPEGKLESLTGNIWFDDKVDSDFSGNLRYFRKATTSGYYTNKFDQSVFVEGSKYTLPEPSKLPLENYSIADVNSSAQAVVNYTGGIYNLLSYSVKWEVLQDNTISNYEWLSEITTPTVPAYRAYGRMNHKYGTFWGNLIAKTTAGDSSEIKTYYRGIILQKQGLITGQAETVGGAVGHYSFLPPE